MERIRQHIEERAAGQAANLVAWANRYPDCARSQLRKFPVPPALYSKLMRPRCQHEVWFVLCVCGCVCVFGGIDVAASSPHAWLQFFVFAVYGSPLGPHVEVKGTSCDAMRQAYVGGLSSFCGACATAVGGDAGEPQMPTWALEFGAPDIVLHVSMISLSPLFHQVRLPDILAGLDLVVSSREVFGQSRRCVVELPRQPPTTPDGAALHSRVATPGGTPANTTLALVLFYMSVAAMELENHGCEEALAYLDALPYFGTFPCTVEAQQSLSVGSVFVRINEAFNVHFLNRAPDDFDIRAHCMALLKAAPNLNVIDCVKDWQSKWPDSRKLQGGTKAPYRMSMMCDLEKLSPEAMEVVMMFVEKLKHGSRFLCRTFLTKRTAYVQSQTMDGCLWPAPFTHLTHRGQVWMFSAIGWQSALEADDPDATLCEPLSTKKCEAIRDLCALFDNVMTLIVETLPLSAGAKQGIIDQFMAAMQERLPGEIGTGRHPAGLGTLLNQLKQAFHKRPTNSRKIAVERATAIVQEELDWVKAAVAEHREGFSAAEKEEKRRRVELELVDHTLQALQHMRAEICQWKAAAEEVSQFNNRLEEETSKVESLSTEWVDYVSTHGSLSPFRGLGFFPKQHFALEGFLLVLV